MNKFKKGDIAKYTADHMNYPMYCRGLEYDESLEIIWTLMWTLNIKDIDNDCGIHMKTWADKEHLTLANHIDTPIWRMLEGENV